MKPQAVIVDEFLRQTVRLRVGRERQHGVFELLMPDGSWFEAPEGVEVVDDGIRLPREVLVAIVDAISTHLGKDLPSQAEVSVLREWLDSERTRVDDVLFAAREMFGRASE